MTRPSRPSAVPPPPTTGPPSSPVRPHPPPPPSLLTPLVGRSPTPVRTKRRLVCPLFPAHSHTHTRTPTHIRSHTRSHLAPDAPHRIDPGSGSPHGQETCRARDRESGHRQGLGERRSGGVHRSHEDPARVCRPSVDDAVPFSALPSLSNRPLSPASLPDDRVPPHLSNLSLSRLSPSLWVHHNRWVNHTSRLIYTIDRPTKDGDTFDSLLPRHEQIYELQQVSPCSGG